MWDVWLKTRNKNKQTKNPEYSKNIKVTNLIIYLYISVLLKNNINWIGLWPYYFPHLKTEENQRLRQ